MTVVLAPPLGATADVWDAQASAVGEVVRYEPRVVPRTIDDLGNEVLALAPERFSFCGLSVGGLIGIWLAVHAPQRVDRLVLACTAAHFPPPQKWEQRAALVRAEGSVAPLAAVTVQRWVGHPDEDLVAMVAGTDVDVYAGCCDVLARTDLRAVLARIEAPTLVVAGQLDEATPPAECAALAAAIPGARFEVIPNAAHLANVERPALFNRLLLEHLPPASAPAGR